MVGKWLFEDMQTKRGNVIVIAGPSCGGKSVSYYGLDGIDLEDINGKEHKLRASLKIIDSEKTYRDIGLAGQKVKVVKPTEFDEMLKKGEILFSYTKYNRRYGPSAEIFTQLERGETPIVIHNNEGVERMIEFSNQFLSKRKPLNFDVRYVLTYSTIEQLRTRLISRQIDHKEDIEMRVNDLIGEMELYGKQLNVYDIILLNNNPIIASSEIKINGAAIKNPEVERTIKRLKQAIINDVTKDTHTDYINRLLSYIFGGRIDYETLLKEANSRKGIEFKLRGNGFYNDYDALGKDIQTYKDIMPTRVVAATNVSGILTLYLNKGDKYDKSQLIEMISKAIGTPKVELIQERPYEASYLGVSRISDSHYRLDDLASFGFYDIPVPSGSCQEPRSLSFVMVDGTNKKTLRVEGIRPMNDFDLVHYGATAAAFENLIKFAYLGITPISAIFTDNRRLQNVKSD